MKAEITTILNALNETPRLLSELISEIDPALYKKEIINGKWSIHEHAVHVAVTDIYGFQKRLKAFQTEDKPIIEPLSGDNFPPDFFINFNLKVALAEFVKMRNTTIELAQQLKPTDWHKEATHPEYKKFTPYIMLRHLLMHDHSHMYKIEDMGFGIGHVK